MTSFPSLITAPLPPANGSSIGESLHHPAFQGMPWKAGHHENWGIFNRRFWGVYVRHSQQLSRAPGLVDAQVGHKVRNLLASLEGREPTGNGREAEDPRRERTSHGCHTYDAANLLTTADAIFRRDRRGEAGEGAAERVGVGEQGWAGVRTAQGFVVVSVSVEVEHRLSATGGQAGKLDERLVDDRLFLGRERTSGRIVDLVERTRLRGRARAKGRVDTNEGAERAVAGRSASIELHAA